ncbi:MAG TPA: plastocyanin/azurin family copper-binding protein [Solirubrobacteraceae bacterium]|jgi:plastocyanin|nr:plastocyanin/azurin family copper-binding protein [Solirubrobacteraceae bacterium]
MHTVAAQLLPVLAAEKSHTPFYIAGGVLVAWALFVSLGLGLRSDFPKNQQGQRAVMGISAVLVAIALVMAVASSGGSRDKTAEAAQPQTTTSAPAETAPSEAPPANETSTGATGEEAKTGGGGTAAPSEAPAAGETTLKLAAASGAELAYSTKSLSAKAGKVTINFTNGSPIEHDVVIAQGSRVLGQTPVFTGGTKALSLTLAKGTYTFYCSVPGHRQAGMEGTLTVS